MAKREHIQMLGWKSIERKTLEFFACPKCDKAVESLGYGESGIVRCYKCDISSPGAKWGKKKVRRTVAVCAGCDRDVPLTPDSVSLFGGPFYLCSECSNVVAVYLGNRIMSPIEILNIGWAKELQRRAQRIKGTKCRAAECYSKREHLVATLLIRSAKNEDSSFLYGSGDDGRTLVCLDERQYVGFLRWSDGKDGKYPVLRQIFVVTNQRRRGIGTAMIRHWAETHAFPLADKFGIESPNEKSIGVLIKLGYAKRSGRGADLVHCYLVPSGI